MEFRQINVHSTPTILAISFSSFRCHLARSCVLSRSPCVHISFSGLRHRRYIVISGIGIFGLECYCQEAAAAAATPPGMIHNDNIHIHIGNFSVSFALLCLFILSVFCILLKCSVKLEDIMNISSTKFLTILKYRGKFNRRALSTVRISLW